MADFGGIGLRAIRRAPTVIIVDDDGDALEELGEIVHTLGYDVVLANDAYEAIETIGNNPLIGIVIADLEMPSFGGLSFLDELDTRFSKLRPILSIVVTGHGTFESAVEAMRFNARDFLLKPVAMDTLAAVLRRTLRV